MDDLISRQQSIDVLHGYFDGMLETDTVCSADIYGLFECMPSVQPETNCSEIPNNSDTISRQAAIDALLGITAMRNTIPLDSAIFNIKKLPSVQPERKKGRWIRNDNGTYSCSVCQSWIPEEQHYYAQYCLYCGADMRGEQE